MSTEPAVPGRSALTSFAKACSSLDRSKYLETHPHPIIIQLSEGPRSHDPKPSGFATIVPDAPAPRAKKREGLWVFEVKKREGANAFGLMVTLGRTKNNDIIIPEPSVSKFHASFKKDEKGAWTVTDTSTNGMRIDGLKIPKEKPQALRSGTHLLLADAIELVFLMPEDVHGYLTRPKP